jgi:HTH-type transcriptional regulator/antitoxin HigA
MNSSIRDDAEYKAALKEVAPYFDTEPERGTGDAIRFELLITSIQAYEDQHFPIGPPDPLG